MRAEPVEATVDFCRKLQTWDGFGVNYVELAQSRDYQAEPQEYGGFSRLNEAQRQEILEMIFGKDGLQPNIVKMFFDPFHQKEPGGSFDHETTTPWMRYFVKEGIRITEEREGESIQVITTLYGPPAWATRQKILRGRDLDPARYHDLAAYMIDWTRFLVEEEHLPVKYLSLHNEGDSPNRWPLDGSSGNIGTGHDYNAFWRPTEVAHFLTFMPDMIREAGLKVGLTPGECTTWDHFHRHWYHWAIHDNPAALKNLALITSHGFGIGDAIHPWGANLIWLDRPELHAWTTSMTWGGKRGMKDYDFVNLIRRNIYEAKVSAVIPWACIQTNTWVGGDPNPGTAFFVDECGTFEVRPQYWYYKQLTRAGRPGMVVATVDVDIADRDNPEIALMAFASNGTQNPNAVVLLNFSEVDKEVRVTLAGCSEKSFAGKRSSSAEHFNDIGTFTLKDFCLEYSAPAGSVTTFFAQRDD
ncbi:MAG: hypothetical protein KJT03_13750 [Verrucomicrobiae bacterium]|nr:hypothetical protein [Verrucomicrobiae bacterium]